MQRKRFARVTEPKSADPECPWLQTAGCRHRRTLTFKPTALAWTHDRESHLSANRQSDSFAHSKSRRANSNHIRAGPER
jgi:hypothetical protein